MLVVMVGWAESRQSALSKYAGLYTGLGLPCVTIAPSVTLSWFSTLGNRVTRQLLSLLDHSLEQPVSVLYHIFSGGGTVVFPQLLAEHETPGSPPHSKLHPAGVVFDSGPALFSREAGLAASRLVYQQGGFNFLTHTLASMTGVLVDLAVGWKRRREHRAALEHQHLLQVPQLYLHSEKDLVFPLDQAREVMEDQRRRGRQVTSHCWPDTEHVRHFMEHPDKYKQKVVDFLSTLQQ